MTDSRDKAGPFAMRFHGALLCLGHFNLAIFCAEFRPCAQYAKHCLRARSCLWDFLGRERLPVALHAILMIFKSFRVGPACLSERPAQKAYVPSCQPCRLSI